MMVEKLKTKICDCGKECPAYPQNRFLHSGDKCYHLDGTFHKINKKN